MSSADHVPSASQHHNPRAARWLFWGALVFLGVIVVTLAIGWVHSRRSLASERRARAEQAAAGPKVAVTRVELSRGERTIVLPGEVRGYRQVTLYPKISGYAVDVRFERGQPVKKGQILAIIASPETDQEEASARSDAITKRLNAARSQALAPSGVVSQMDRDNAAAAAIMAEAELKRSHVLRGYEIVRAPFDGIATARYVDPGALLPAATGSTQSAVPVADVADLDRVRVFLYLGQDRALFSHAGDAAAVWESERPDRHIAASLTRCGTALDPRTRTMTCEIEIDNRSYDLRPGSSVNIELQQKVPAVPAIPSEALLVRGGDTMVAVVRDERVHLQPIVVADNDGRTVRVQRGLSGGEMIAVNVPVEVEEGTRVRPAERPPAGAASASTTNQPGIGGGPEQRPADAGAEH